MPLLFLLVDINQLDKQRLTDRDQRRYRPVNRHRGWPVDRDHQDEDHHVDHHVAARLLGFDIFPVMLFCFFLSPVIGQKLRQHHRTDLAESHKDEDHQIQSFPIQNTAERRLFQTQSPQRAFHYGFRPLYRHVDRHDDRQLNEAGQNRRERIDPVFLVQPLHFLRLSHLRTFIRLAFILLGNAVHLRLDDLHLLRHDRRFDREDQRNAVNQQRDDGYRQRDTDIRSQKVDQLSQWKNEERVKPVLIFQHIAEGSF